MSHPQPTVPKRPSKNNRQLAQAIVEFALALPILLMLIFGIVEFGRFLQAWLALENGARFGVRYASTGNYNPQYCAGADAALGLAADDTYGGDPVDCKVPYSVTNWEDETSQLQDWARLPSIRDVALSGSAGIDWNGDPAISGNYPAYLTAAYGTPNFTQANRGNPSQRGYFNVTICSNRITFTSDTTGTSFQFDTNSRYYTPYIASIQSNYRFPDYCEKTTGTVASGVYTQTGIERYLDDAGGPGDRVRVVLTYRHPLITPTLESWWQTILITSQREAIVEQFRTSRVTGLTGSIGEAPIWTLTPSNTPTYTNTSTYTNTPTKTDTATATATMPSNTPTATKPSNTPSATKPSNTPSATKPSNTPSATKPSRTPKPTKTPTATKPTDTPSPTVPTDTPTATRPTDTPSPTRPTDTPIPTDTSPPDTMTPTPSKTPTPPPTVTRVGSHG